MFSLRFVNIRNGIKPSLHVGLLQVHVLAEVLEVEQGIEFGRAILSLVHKIDLIFAQFVGVKQIGVVGRVDQLRRIALMEQPDDILHQLVVQAGVDLVNQQHLVLLDDVHSSSSDVPPGMYVTVRFLTLH